ncbi:MAG TPA: OmpA family protein [Vicinamibacterales bacterium]|nr:OmpA family protein [Vicinamibacterales bacterium]
MTPRRLAPMLAFLLAISACAPRPRTTPDATAPEVVALLPDPDSGRVGRARVSNNAGAVELSEARASTRISSKKTAPVGPVILSEADASRLFGDVLASLPPAPQHFTVNFEFDSDEPTGESRAMLPQILAVVKGRPFPEVLVIGHTDTIGTRISNITLGMRRAELIRKLLIEAGLDASLIEIASHGEADLLIPTGDEVAEPRNRRVEITVR